MILQLAEYHGYANNWLFIFDDVLGKHIDIAGLAKLATEIPILITEYDEDSDTIYIAHPESY